MWRRLAEKTGGKPASMEGRKARGGASLSGSGAWPGGAMVGGCGAESKRREDGTKWMEVMFSI